MCCYSVFCRPVWRCLRSRALPPALVYVGEEWAAVPHCHALGLWSLCGPLQWSVPDMGERKEIREDFKVWGGFYYEGTTKENHILFFFFPPKKREKKWENINNARKPRPGP